LEALIELVTPEGFAVAIRYKNLKLAYLHELQELFQSFIFLLLQ